jgi:hypothetical protein
LRSIGAVRSRERGMVAFYPSGGRFRDFVLIRGPGWQHGGLPYGPGTVFFSGLAVTGHELVSTADRFDPYVSSRTTRKIETKSFAGCYSAVVRRRGYIAIVNDLFGLCPIYYYNDENYTIVSNRSHLISLTMLNCGIRRLPNLEVICTISGFASSAVRAPVFARDAPERFADLPGGQRPGSE